jgi:hypothetical protein
MSIIHLHLQQRWKVYDINLDLKTLLVHARGSSPFESALEIGQSQKKHARHHGTSIYLRLSRKEIQEQQGKGKGKWSLTTRSRIVLVLVDVNPVLSLILG